MNKCKYCDIPIEYEEQDAIYFHTQLTWGKDFDTAFKDNDMKHYNNGYWCSEERITSANPIKLSK